MAVYTVTQAKAQLSALIANVLAGEEVVISRSGKPLVQLIVWQPPLDSGPKELGIDESNEIHMLFAAGQGTTFNDREMAKIFSEGGEDPSDAEGWGDGDLPPLHDERDDEDRR